VTGGRQENQGQLLGSQLNSTLFRASPW
jgi:hypothetical protein